MDRILLLVPSSTYRAADFVAAATKLGLELIVGSEEEPVSLAAAGMKQVPLRDADAGAAAIVDLDREAPLDGVVAVDDQGTVVAAKAAERLGLRHNPPEAVAAARDKLRMRDLLGGAEVPQPAFAAVPSGAGTDAVRRAASVVGLPCVVKPTRLSGSQGVIRADTPAEAVAAVERVRSIAARAGSEPDEPLLIEEFVSGPEVALEGVLTRGKLTVLAVFDKPDPLEGPYFEETLYVTPSALDSADIGAAALATQAATRALGLTEGPVHAELRVRGGRAWVIEVAARSIGGLCSRTLEFGTGVSLEYLILAHALGRPIDSLQRREGAAGVLMLPTARAGRLVEVRGREQVLKMPGIVGLELTIAPGRSLVPLPEGNRYLGFLFARGERPSDVEAALRAAQAELEVVVEPEGLTPQVGAP